MLKSLFFRKNSDADELLPPPPPFPSMNLEEPKQDAVSESKFEGLFKDFKKQGLEVGIKSTKAKPKKLSKKELKRLAKINAKAAKLNKKETKNKSKPKEEFYDLDKGFDFGHEPEFNNLEEFDIGDLKAEEEEKPKEIEEAEDEIAGAIEDVKKHRNKSFFDSLFGKKSPGQQAMPEIEASDLDAIRKKIADARNSLMGLDIESAKNSYIEMMVLYNRLNPEEQAMVYHEIRDIYYERKNAEELKV